MVIGVKFTALPGDGQFLIRRAAYHRIRDAFAANGIRFHERNVAVRVAAPAGDPALLAGGGDAVS
jgi:hypothetical protein